MPFHIDTASAGYLRNRIISCQRNAVGGAKGPTEESATRRSPRSCERERGLPENCCMRAAQRFPFRACVRDPRRRATRCAYTHCPWPQGLDPHGRRRALSPHVLGGGGTPDSRLHHPYGAADGPLRKGCMYVQLCCMQRCSQASSARRWRGGSADGMHASAWQRRSCRCRPCLRLFARPAPIACPTVSTTATCHAAPTASPCPAPPTAPYAGRCIARGAPQLSPIPPSQTPARTRTVGAPGLPHRGRILLEHPPGL